MQGGGRALLCAERGHRLGFALSKPVTERPALAGRCRSAHARSLRAADGGPGSPVAAAWAGAKTAHPSTPDKPGPPAGASPLGPRAEVTALPVSGPPSVARPIRVRARLGAAIRRSAHTESSLPRPLRPSRDQSLARKGSHPPRRPAVMRSRSAGIASWRPAPSPRSVSVTSRSVMEGRDITSHAITRDETAKLTEIISAYLLKQGNPSGHSCQESRSEGSEASEAATL